MGKFAFLGHAAIYGAASILLQAAGLVLLPLYTRQLGPADFGILEIITRTGDVLTTCLLVSGIRQALVAFYQQSETEAERLAAAPTGLLILLAGCVMGGGLLLLAAGPLSAALGLSDPWLTRRAIVAVLADPFWLVPLTLMQARVESGLYLVTTLTQFLVKVALSVILVAWLDWGVTGVVTAMLLTSGSYAVLLTGRELARNASRPNFRQLGAMLRFALPFLPGGLCFFVLNYGDRYFLLSLHGMEEVGTYALGYKLALAVGTLSFGPLQMVWSVRMYGEARSARAAAVFGRAFTRIVAAYAFVGLGLCLFRNEVVHVLGGRAYARAGDIILPIVIAGLFQTAASVMDSGLYICNRTELKVGLTLSATAVTCIGYCLLIPGLGGLGAAFATVAGFAFLAVCTWSVTQRVFPVDYEWRRIGWLLGLAASVLLVAGLAPNGPWAILLKGALLILWPWSLWQLGLVAPDEKQYLHGLACEARGWLQHGWARRRPRTLAIANSALPRKDDSHGVRLSRRRGTHSANDRTWK